LVLLATVTLSTEAFAGATAAPSGNPNYPVDYSFLSGFASGFSTPQTPPPGANVSCRPTDAHPYPVVLVHGTFENQDDNWQALSPLLADNRYCVYSFNYGGSSASSPIQGTGDIPTSAEQLSVFVNHVLATTHATKVDIVGHSQGGMMPRYYLDFLGGATKVNDLVGLSPSNHGTTEFGLLTLLSQLPGGAGTDFLDIGCTSCAQQTAGSPFLQALNAGGDTVPGVTYTVIETRYDEVVTPYTSAFLSGPRVTNITLQDQCPDDFSEHLTTPYDPNALHDVLNALDPATATPVRCVSVPRSWAESRTETEGGAGREGRGGEGMGWTLPAGPGTATDVRAPALAVAVPNCWQSTPANALESRTSEGGWKASARLPQCAVAT
jgi:triacylglycerol esterase/lipase EstA (alpha/beta hydrolase family)